MSLIKWSTPERRVGNTNLPIIPNEIHLIILEHIAPSSGRLSVEQLKDLSSLSLVCRFFGNFCLPRIFEYTEFSGSVYGNHISRTHAASRGRTLCQQIAAKQHLALSLAQCVKVCHITDWQLGDEGSWAVQMFSQRYVAGMAHMKNIRELMFFRSFVKQGHWDVITTLESLEKLGFDSCNFLDGPAHLGPDQRFKVKVPFLRVSGCSGHHQLSAAIDARHLRTLMMDEVFGGSSWLYDTPPLTELQVFADEQPLLPMDTARYLRVKRILRETSWSLQVLRLPVYACSDFREILFEDPVWKNMPLLRSLTLEIVLYDPDPAVLMNVGFSV
ncbi:hypothetical protein BS17DRAFT_786902 [Gyrodon lividus]|nr:hypothetical protein BS17DRAFT_786902 [Gyrodon lividus]